MNNVEGFQVLLELVSERVVDVLQPPVVRDVGSVRPKERDWTLFLQEQMH